MTCNIATNFMVGSLWGKGPHVKGVLVVTLRVKKTVLMPGSQLELRTNQISGFVAMPGWKKIKCVM